MKSVRNISIALDSLYQRLGYVRSHRVLSDLSLAVWVLFRKDRYDNAMTQIRGFTSVHNSYWVDLMGLDYPFLTALKYVFRLMGFVVYVIALRPLYGIQFTDPIQLTVMTLTCVASLYWYWTVGVQFLVRCIPINNTALFSQLLREDRNS